MILRKIKQIHEFVNEQTRTFWYVLRYMENPLNFMCAS